MSIANNQRNFNVNVYQIETPEKVVNYFNRKIPKPKFSVS